MNTAAKGMAVLVLGGMLVGWRFMNAWRTAWDADAADWVKVQARQHATEDDDD